MNGPVNCRSSVIFSVWPRQQAQNLSRLSNFFPDADQVTVSDSDNVLCSAADSRVVDNYYLQSIIHGRLSSTDVVFINENYWLLDQ